MLRKLILILCLLTLCITISSAGITDKLKSVIARKNVAAGAPCTSFEENLTETPDANGDLRDDASTYYLGNEYRDGSSARDICQLSYKFTTQGDIETAGINVRVCICDRDDGDNNDIEDNGDGLTMAADCTQCSAWVSGDNGWSNTTVTVTFSPAVTIAQNTEKVFVIDTSIGLDATNYIEVDYDTSESLTVGLEWHWWDSTGDATQSQSGYDWLSDVKAE